MVQGNKAFQTQHRRYTRKLRDSGSKHSLCSHSLDKIPAWSRRGELSLPTTNIRQLLRKKSDLVDRIVLKAVWHPEYLEAQTGFRKLGKSKKENKYR